MSGWKELFAAEGARGLLVAVYHMKPDCSANGRSELADTILVFGAEDCPMEGYIEPGTYEDYQMGLLTRGPLGDPIIRMGPSLAQQIRGQKLGPMMGGNLAYTPDSRWSKAVGFYGAVPIHDRYETSQQYKELSE
jgi:hypothetical protein